MWFGDDILDLNALRLQHIKESKLGTSAMKRQ